MRCTVQEVLVNIRYEIEINRYGNYKLLGGLRVKDGIRVSQPPGACWCQFLVWGYLWTYWVHITTARTRVQDVCNHVCSTARAVGVTAAQGEAGLINTVKPPRGAALCDCLNRCRDPVGLDCVHHSAVDELLKHGGLLGQARGELHAGIQEIMVFRPGRTTFQHKEGLWAQYCDHCD
jgi:hypothetical protein